MFHMLPIKKIAEAEAEERRKKKEERRKRKEEGMRERERKDGRKWNILTDRRSDIALGLLRYCPVTVTSLLLI